MRFSRPPLYQLLCTLISTPVLPAHPIHAATEVCGTFKLATEWTKAESPYLVTGDIYIPETSRLRIGPGVEVRFAKPKPCPSDTAEHELEDWSDSAYTGIKAEGTFYCLGTEEQPVVFTSDAGKAGTVGWDGIRLSGQNAHSSEISFGIFKGANQAITAERAGFFIHHCLFIGNNTGVMLNLRGDLGIVNNNFIDNLSAGIVIRKASPRIANNIFLNNKSYGIWADTRPSIQIMNNAFWGNREMDCYKCTYTVLQKNKLNANKDTADAFGNLSIDPVFLGTASFDSAHAADLHTDTPAHLVKDADLAKIEAKARKKKEPEIPFVPLGTGNYLLSQYSKLRRAGHKGAEFKNRDGNTNDIGVHGGPMGRMTKDPF